MFNLLIVVVAPVNPLITQYKLPLRVRSETSSSLSAPSGRLDKTESKSGVECWLVHQEQMGQLKGGGHSLWVGQGAGTSPLRQLISYICMDREAAQSDSHSAIMSDIL